MSQFLGNIVEEIEKRGKKKFKLSDEWEMYKIDIGDPDIAKVGFGKRGPKGGWLRGKENRVEGLVVWSDLNPKNQTTG